MEHTSFVVTVIWICTIIIVGAYSALQVTYLSSGKGK